jgi:hypothetical protein
MLAASPSRRSNLERRDYDGSRQCPYYDRTRKFRLEIETFDNFDVIDDEIRRYYRS